jgi:Flp pilus assembly protein TadD
VIASGLGVRAAAVLMSVAVPSLAQLPPAPVGMPAAALVMPFQVSPRDPATAWLGEGAAILVTDALRGAGGAAIGREERLAALDRLRVPNLATLSYATVIRVAEIVAADVAIVGAIEMTGDQVVVRARRIQVDAGHLFGEVVERGAIGSFLETMDRVAAGLAPPSSVAAAPRPARPSVAAFEHYVNALVARNAERAAALFSRALAVAPTFQEARLALAEAHAAQGNHRLAVEEAQRVPDAHPMGRRARFLRALSLMELGRLSEAFDGLTALQAATPSAAIANNLGVVQLRRPSGSPGGRAVLHFTEATRLDTGDAELFFNLGYAHLLEDSYWLATDALRESVRRDPYDAAAHSLLASALLGTGGASEAARERDLASSLSSALVPDPGSGDSQIARGLERVKATVDARTVRRDEGVSGTDQRTVAAFHVDVARRAADAGHDADAVAALRRALYLSPYEVSAHLLLGRIHQRNGRPRDAIDSFKIALWIGDAIETRLALAESLISVGDVPGARAELQTILSRDAGHARARELADTLPRP